MEETRPRDWQGRFALARVVVMKSPLLFLLFSTSFGTIAKAEPPSAKIQFPDLAKMPDRTADFRKQIAENEGAFLIEPGVHRITGTLEITLESRRSALVRPAAGPVTLIMDGPGPAIRIAGSHDGSASPKTFKPATWNERMPVIEGIEIIGNHPEADGIELFQTVEPVVSKVAVRWCRHGIHLVTRNRNVTISDVHLYENSGIGLFLDDVNLHQTNVCNSHISYNRGGGIVVRDGNVRNLQITGCDIESNMPGDNTATETANVLLDLSKSAEDPTRSIAEVAITGCTIQHSSNYSGKDFTELAPGGANIRLLGKAIAPIDSVTITGNVMSDVSLNVDLRDCMDIVFANNTLFAPNPDNLHVTRCRRVVVNANTFNPREFERPGRIIFEDCQDCLFTGNSLRGLLAEDGTVIARNSRRLLLTNNILSESKSGILLEHCEEVTAKDWIVSGLPEGVSWIVPVEAGR